MASSLFFVEGKCPSTKPTLLQRKRLATLRSRGFTAFTDEYMQMLKRLFAVVKNVVILDDDIDDFAVRCQCGDDPGPVIPHPYLWKRLGFSCEYPDADFRSYVEVLPGVEFDKLSPTNARWCGGILTLDCLLYFLQHPNPQVSTKAMGIVKNRLRLNELTSRNYRIIIVAMELVRSLGLTFYVFSTKTVPPSVRPIQPNVRPYPSFQIDFVPKERLKHPDTFYPMRSFWNFVAEKDGFERCFSAAFLLFEHFFEQNSFDPELTMQQTGEAFEELLSVSESVSSLEKKVLVDILQERDSYVTSSS